MKTEKCDLSEKELLEKILSKLDQQPNKKLLYSNKEAMDMLGVKDKYMKKLRDNGYIGYSREGDKYWYPQEDMDKFLRKFHYEPFATNPNLPRQEGGRL
jgi:phage pi2 protein 07